MVSLPWTLNSIVLRSARAGGGLEPSSWGRGAFWFSPFLRAGYCEGDSEAVHFSLRIPTQRECLQRGSLPVSCTVPWKDFLLKYLAGSYFRSIFCFDLATVRMQIIPLPTRWHKLMVVIILVTLETLQR